MRILIFVVAGLLAFTGTAQAYPPAAITDVTRDSLTVGGLDCGTEYRIRLEERSAIGWSSPTTRTMTTESCSYPPPTAAFTARPNPAVWDQPTTFTSSSSCPDAPCSYRWFHGDATSSEEIEAGAAQPNTQAAFTYASQPYWFGPATVTLRVTDASGDVDTETVTLQIVDSDPDPAPTPTPTPDVTQQSLTVGGLDCGTEYRIRLEERSAIGWSSPTTHTVTTESCSYPPPTAAFTARPNPAVWDQPTTFTSSSSCPDAPCSYRWFHGGATSSEEIEAGAAQPNTQAAFTYVSRPYWFGPATVTLRVTDASGDVDTETVTLQIVDSDPGPPPPSPPAPTPPPTPIPQPSGYPNASNTGPTGTLTASTGNVTITTAGAVVENRQINGCVTVNAPNVVIRNVKITCTTNMYALWSGSTGLRVEDSEIDCGNRGANSAGITPSNYTARRVEVSRCENLLWAGNNTTIEDSYLHDPVPYDPVDDPHTDSVQAPGDNVTIRHNRIYGGYVSQSNFGNSAITTAGGMNNFLVEDNILAGGGYTLRCEGSGTNVNYRIINNRFSTVFTPRVGGFGPVNGCAPRFGGGSSWPLATSFLGNVYHETGLPL